MKKNLLIILLIAIPSLFMLSVFVLLLLPQAAAPKIHPDDLVRPEPLTIIKSNDPRGLLEKIHDILVDEDFAIVKSDSESIEARRLDRPNEPESSYYRVIIWLERDLERSDEYIKAFFIWARYELILGTERAIRRVIALAEGPIIARLKAAIIALSSSSGGLE